jgi:hypothetical protein
MSERTLPQPRGLRTIVAAVIFTGIVLTLGYISFGLWTMLIFTSGFVGGLVLWLTLPSRGTFREIRLPLFLALALFVIHRIEEYQSRFFSILSQITGTPTPDVSGWPVILLLVMSVGAWLLIPVLVIRRIQFGYYLAWTFFAAMGITELAHLVVFPVVVGRPFEYFPGMGSVFLLAPIAWWGAWRLAKGKPGK